MPEANQAFVTLATSDAYCMGSLVVGKCLRRYGTTRKLVVMVSPNISREARLSLEDVFDEVIVVDVLDSGDRAHLSWLGRPDLGVTFTKLHCWTLTQYTKCVFLDADTLVLCNIDELFEREELSAAPDPGWPDCFNSGVFVFRPSLDTHSRLLEHANMHGSFDGGDQGLLNSFFSDWAIKDINKHLPFIYNLSGNAVYTYLPAFHKYGHQAKIVHFLGKTKPWHFSCYQQPSSEVPQWDSNRKLEPYVNLWWAGYNGHAEPHVNEPHELQDSAPIEHRPHPSASSHTAPHPQSHESGSEAPNREEKTPSESLTELTFNVRSSSTCHQLEEMLQTLQCSDPDVVSAGDTEDLERSELQEPPFGQQQEGEVLRAESSESSTAALAETGSDTAAVETSEASSAHRRRWEEGHIDYLGKDAFENIRIKLDQFLN